MRVRLLFADASTRQIDIAEDATVSQLRQHHALTDLGSTLSFLYQGRRLTEQQRLDQLAANPDPLHLHVHISVRSAHSSQSANADTEGNAAFSRYFAYGVMASVALIWALLLSPAIPFTIAFRDWALLVFLSCLLLLSIQVCL